jgi:hypothetical protein
MPPNSPSLEDAVDRIHHALDEQERNTLDYIDEIAKSGFADKRWCAVARTDIEKGFMAAHRALRDYPSADPAQYGKVPLDQPLPRQFQPRVDANTNPRQPPPPPRQIAKLEGQHVEWGDYSPDGDLGSPDQPPDR